MARPSVSEHLRALHESGLVEERQEGRHRLYRVTGEPLPGPRRCIASEQPPSNHLSGDGAPPATKRLLCVNPSAVSPAFSSDRLLPIDLSPVAAVRRTLHAHFEGLTLDQAEEMRQRLTLVVAEPALRAAMLEQNAEAMRLIAKALADRASRDRSDLAVRAIAGAVMGVLMASLEAWTEDPAADLPTIVDATLEHLENGLSL